MLLSPYSTSTLQGAIPPPTTYWRFNQTAILPSEITFTRVGNASVFNQAGTLETASTNVARFDYSPATSALRGWLLEESRSNTLNTAMTGGVAGIPGTQPTGWSISTAPSGMTRTLAYGTEDGMPCIDVRYAGTVPAGVTNVTASLAGTNTISASAGQTWTQSFFARLIAGSWTNVLPSSSPLATNGTSGVQSFDETIYPTTARLSAQRFTRTLTITNASTTHIQPRFRFGLTAGTAVDFTVRISWPQITQNAFDTSPVPGGTTRQSESAVISGTNFTSLFGGRRYSAMIDSALLGFTESGTLLSLDDGTSNNRVQSRILANGSANFRVVIGGSGVGDLTSTIPSSPTRRRTVLVRDMDGVSMYSNGVFCGHLGVLPAMDRLRIMSGPSSSNASGHVREMMLWRDTALGFQQALQLSAQVF